MSSRWSRSARPSCALCSSHYPNSYELALHLRQKHRLMYGQGFVAQKSNIFAAMPRYPETQALLQQALSHTLLEQQNLLKREDRSELTEILIQLNALATQTGAVLKDRLDSSLAAALPPYGKCITSIPFLMLMTISRFQMSHAIITMHM